MERGAYRRGNQSLSKGKNARGGTRAKNLTNQRREKGGRLKKRKKKGVTHRISTDTNTKAECTMNQTSNCSLKKNLRVSARPNCRKCPQILCRQLSLTVVLGKGRGADTGVIQQSVGLTGIVDGGGGGLQKTFKGKQGGRTAVPGLEKKKVLNQGRAPATTQARVGRDWLKFGHHKTPQPNRDLHCEQESSREP